MSNDKNIKIVDTSTGKENGTNRCPHCHASDITYDIKKRKLICNYCHTEFEGKDVTGIEKNVQNLRGETRTTGTSTVKHDNEIVTLKCSGCGAEIVVNASETLNVRCHWCRSILSIHSKVENGAIPDYILPFYLDKDIAKTQIEKFVKKRRFYANSRFKKEFSSENIMGVYFPYILVDANCHANFQGHGGIVTGSHEKVVGKDKDGNEIKETIYDIDIYKVGREFDIQINDLSLEASKDKIKKERKDKTTNIINAIMPFDTKSCVQFEPNYLIGYTSEARDINIENIEHKVEQSIADVARYSINPDIRKYDAGVTWDRENVFLLGTQWVSAYLPVWLYSFQTKKKQIHYIAVNARTGETMGSVPFNRFKLFLVSFLIFVLCSLILPCFLFFGLHISLEELIRIPFIYIVLPLTILAGCSYYGSKKEKYRNKGERHRYEIDTERTISNLVRIDKRCSDTTSHSPYLGSNSHKIVGDQIGIEEKDEKSIDDKKEVITEKK